MMWYDLRMGAPTVGAPKGGTGKRKEERGVRGHRNGKGRRKRG